MLLGLATHKDINLIDNSGRPCHFVEVPLKAPRLLMSDAIARGLGVSWRAGWSILMADPTFITNLDSVTTATLSVHAHKYRPLALAVYMGYLFDAPLPGDRQETQNVIVANAKRLTEMLPVPVLLENAPSGPGDAPKWSLEPEFIWQTLFAAECGMLLNIAHALINAELLNMTPELYFEMLPLEAVVQIRLSGVRHSAARGALYNARDALTQLELDALQYVLTRAAPKAIVLDFGRNDPAQIVEQMAAIRQAAGLPEWPANSYQ
jgi:uncharacterized protein (UPF0276 family)